MTKRADLVLSRRMQGTMDTPGWHRLHVSIDEELRSRLQVHHSRAQAVEPELTFSTFVRRLLRGSVDLLEARSVQSTTSTHEG